MGAGADYCCAAVVIYAWPLLVLMVLGSATGVGGDAFDTSASQSGAAHVWENAKGVPEWHPVYACDPLCHSFHSLAILPNSAPSLRQIRMIASPSLSELLTFKLKERGGGRMSLFSRSEPLQECIFKP